MPAAANETDTQEVTGIFCGANNTSILCLPMSVSRQKNGSAPGHANIGYCHLGNHGAGRINEILGGGGLNSKLPSICLEGNSMTPPEGTILFSFLPASLFISSDPLGAF